MTWELFAPGLDEQQVVKMSFKGAGVGRWVPNHSISCTHGLTLCLWALPTEAEETSPGSCVQAVSERSLVLPRAQAPSHGCWWEPGTSNYSLRT